jgi:hypothetical protein
VVLEEVALNSVLSNEHDEKATYLMAVLNVPSADWLTLGLELVRFSKARQNDHKKNLW